MNLSDGERIHAVLKEMGFLQTDSEEEAQIVGIIACSVRQKAIDKVYNQIARWNRRKNNQNLITFISGCILPDDRERFLKLFDIVVNGEKTVRVWSPPAAFGAATAKEAGAKAKGDRPIADKLVGRMKRSVRGKSSTSRPP